MAANYSKSKGRGRGKGHFGLPKEVIQHDNFKQLSSYGNKLVIDLGQQYLGKNNGDLCATWVFMRERGWKSKDTLNDALRELEYYGLIVQTQMGGLNLPSLYAFSWNRIDKATTASGWLVGDLPGSWKQYKPPFQKPSSVRAKKKKQVRLPVQSGTAPGAVKPNLRAIK